MSAASRLRAKYVTLGEQLRHNHFKRSIYLESAESSREVGGEIYALFDYPIAKVITALKGAAHWCDVFMLPINTKYCRASVDSDRTSLSVGIGKKDERPEDASQVEFSYRVVAATPEYFAVQLHADNGPLGTNNYRILVEFVSVEGARTFLHLTYAYAYGLTARLAMQAYLGTVGRNKVGFTMTDRRSNGDHDYVGGMRGVVERNTMRYYLAIDAFLGALDAPPGEQLEKRLHRWFISTEQYPRQLQELSRTAYLEMKRMEYQRQQTTVR